MKAFIVSDKDYETEVCINIIALIKEYLEEHQYSISETQIGRDDIKPCMGCFGCWVKKPGECVIRDEMTRINQCSITHDAVFYVCPIVFGQFAANIKNVIDRWLPNMLPFFVIRPDGSTMHTPRYKDYPKQIMIGYGEQLSDDDAMLFSDITKKHRHHADVIIYDNDTLSFQSKLRAIVLKREGGHL